MNQKMGKGFPATYFVLELSISWCERHPFLGWGKMWCKTCFEDVMNSQEIRFG